MRKRGAVVSAGTTSAPWEAAERMRHVTNPQNVEGSMPSNENTISHRWRAPTFASNVYFLISRFYFSCRPAVGFIAWLGHALLNVDGDSDRWRSEDMLMVRVDHPTREEIPLTGFHVAQGWKLWPPLGVKPGCEKLGGVEFVHHVFRCGLGLRRVVNHGALTALEAVLARCFCLIDGHFGLRSEYASDCEYLGLGGPLEGENICILGADASQFSTASVGNTYLG